MRVVFDRCGLWYLVIYSVPSPQCASFGGCALWLEVSTNRHFPRPAGGHVNPAINMSSTTQRSALFLDATLGADST